MNINTIQIMRLVNIKCSDKESFEYSILLYLCYYNIQKNHGRVIQLLFNTDPYLSIKFNENNDINQFEKDNPHIDLLIIDVNNNPLFLTRNSANIKVTIVKLNNNRYSLKKPTIEYFNANINEINRLKKDTVNMCLMYLFNTLTIKYDINMYF